MSSERIITTGAAGGQPAPRREINDFVKDEKHFSLYIQALILIKSRSQTKDDSFFQVGGIHGLPYTVWNGAGAKGVEPNGYCTHGSTLFPTWHRPYVALYEQLLHQLAQDIACQYSSEKESWKAAAAALRQPYWDWALNAVPPPEVMSMDKVTITTPKGRESVDNPLRRYKFNPMDPSFSQASPDGRFKDWQTTLRHPVPPTGPNAKDDVAALRSTLEAAQKTRSITTNTYALLTRVHTWPAFSNHTPTEGGTANSLEAIHDGIHNLVGGNGHMGNVAMAGFDPIFYLHHTNVDRVLSLWSAIHPHRWVTPGQQEEGTETIPAGSQVDINTALTPFWNSATDFWPSATIADTRNLRYTYPEFADLDMPLDPGTVRNAIAWQVNRLYGDAVYGGVSPAFQSLARRAASDVKGHPTAVAAGNDVNMWEWSARIRFKHMELGTSFSVPIFLGAVPEDPKDWLTASTLVGAHHAFVNGAAESCANCQRRKDEMNEGFVHLNGGIASGSGVDSFDPSHVKPYLTEQMQWRVLRTDGTPAQLESLEVLIVSNSLTWPVAAPLPSTGGVVHYPDITRGRPGGAK